MHLSLLFSRAYPSMAPSRSTQQICIHNHVSQFAAYEQHGFDDLAKLPRHHVSLESDTTSTTKIKVRDKKKTPWPWPQTLHFKLKLTFACLFPPTASPQQRHDFPPRRAGCVGTATTKKRIKAAAGHKFDNSSTEYLGCVCVCLCW